MFLNLDPLPLEVQVFLNFGPFQSIIFALYFVPTILAFVLHSRNKALIILVNILLGSIFGIGWFAAIALAIVWRSKSEQKRTDSRLSS